MSWFCPRCGHDADADGTCPRDGEPLVRVSQHDLVGRPLGEYKILASLGGGSFGSVYRAVHQRSGMLAAIKLLHRPIDDAESQRVIVEARAAAMLSHPNVVQVYDLALTSDRRPYIVMQLLDGQPLGELIGQHVEVPRALSIASDVLAGLDAAHRRGVIHRDLKPDNIFLAKGRAIIVDFGLAKLIADPRAPSLTVTGDALGTPHYMAPEQVRGELADGRSDVYAAGCVLFEILAGAPPYPDSATFAIFDAHLNAPIPSLVQLRPDVPPHVDAAVARALAKDPAARFATATEMRAALANTPPTTTKPKRRWPLVAGVAAIALGATVVAGAIVARTGEPPSQTVGPHRAVVPPALPDEPALDPKMEQALEMIAAQVRRGTYKREEVVLMRCAMQQLYANPSTPDALRAYARRHIAMLQSGFPDLDPAVECRASTSSPNQQHRKVDTPPPLPDELPVFETIEDAIDTFHAELDAGRYTRDAARAAHCAFDRQDREAIAERGRVEPHVRGMHRRLAILFEAYHPGVTSTPCK